MTAEYLARALGGRRVGTTWMCHCPVHDDRDPSLAVRVQDGLLLVCCHAGCEQSDVVAALRQRGLWLGQADTPHPRVERQQPQVPDREAGKRTELARAIWLASRPAAATLVEVYLRSRGLATSPPPSLRFHPSLRHTPTGVVLPALVAAVQDPTGHVVAIHRTYLRADGQGKASVSDPKLALGPLGHGAVRLYPEAAELGLAEGVETGLSAYELFGISIWTALGARLHQVALPDIVRHVHVFADNGGPGMAAANRAVEAFTRQGRRVSLRFPPRGFGDWNDDLVALRREEAGGVAA